MKPFRLSIIMVLSVFSIVSCQPEITGEESPKTGSDTLLTRVITKNLTDSQTDISVSDIIYDQQGRIIKTKDAAYDSSNVNNVIELWSDSIVFMYEGNSRSPYKSKTYQMLSYSDDAVYHKYDAQGRLVLDSVPFESGAPAYVTRKYVYKNDQVIATKQWSDDLSTSGVDTFYFSGGNITKAAYEYAHTQSGRLFTIKYDNHINLMSRLNIASVCGIDFTNPFDKFTVFTSGYCKNNITSMENFSDDFPDSPYKITYTYTFNKNGYPLTATHATDGVPDVVTTFYYK